MKGFQRFAALTVLAAFLGLTAAGTLHQHADLQPQTDCVVCKIVHQTPALSMPLALEHGDVSISEVLVPAVPHPYLQFVFASHGRSPPVL
jgi:hypothetical protein